MRGARLLKWGQVGPAERLASCRLGVCLKLQGVTLARNESGFGWRLSLITQVSSSRHSGEDRGDPDVTAPSLADFMLPTWHPWRWHWERCSRWLSSWHPLLQLSPEAVPLS